MEELWAVGKRESVEKIYADDSGRLYIYEKPEQAEIAAISLKARLGVAEVFRIGIGSLTAILKQS